MIFEISITEEAEKDIRSAYLYYENQKEDLGKEFEFHLTNTINLIHQNPLLIQIKYHQFRIANLKKFPYGVHFTIQNNQILIVAVFHFSRNPKNWPIDK